MTPSPSRVAARVAGVIGEVIAPMLASVVWSSHHRSNTNTYNCPPILMHDAVIEQKQTWQTHKPISDVNLFNLLAKLRRRQCG